MNFRNRVVILTEMEYNNMVLCADLDICQTADLVAYIKSNGTYYIAKSRATKNGQIVDSEGLSTIINANLSRYITETNKLHTSSYDLNSNPFKDLEISKPYLFAINARADITALVRSITFTDATHMQIDYLMDEKDIMETFFIHNSEFHIQILNRIGEVTRDVCVKIKESKIGFPLRLSHDATDTPLIFRREFILK